jgi:glycerol-3-phosphate dehydrogenase (NAD(P)+)
MALGAGRSPGDVLAERNVVTEGVHSAASIGELGRRLGVQVPIVRAVNRIVNEGAWIDETFADLLAQPTGRELADLI